VTVSSNRSPLDEDFDSLDLQPLQDLDSLGADWNELAEQTGNVFSTREWNSIWWRHFGAADSQLTTACRSNDGCLVAVLPLYLWRSRPFRIVRFLGHDVGDQLGPICLPRHRRAASEALAATLSRCEADIFVGEHLLGDEGWTELLDAKLLARSGSPALRFDGRSWDEFLASRSSNLRGHVRTRERSLMRAHEARYRLTTTNDELESDLDTVFALHAARWAGRTSSFMKSEAFHRDFATVALERGWLRLWLLEIDGRPRAAWYGFRFGGIESFYQGGRDPSWDKHSLGFLVLTHSIREALADGMSEYRFLRGGEAYKYRFANLDPGVETIGLARGVAPRAILAAVPAARRSRMLKGVLSAFARGWNR
jgi:CelD/BcsL family acetyltransferase involved in cellulose biosynthesis